LRRRKLPEEFLANAGGVTVAYFGTGAEDLQVLLAPGGGAAALDEKMTRVPGRPEMYQREKVTMRQAAYLVAISRVTEANKRCGGCKHRLIGPRRSRSLLEPDGGGNAEGR
jgi:glutamate dehydrogenase/leucine dehydrogenase